MKSVLKGFLIVCLLLSATSDLFSQKKKKGKSNSIIETADKYFKNLEYYLAAQEYSKALQNDPENKYALFRLGESKRAYFNYQEAEAAYKKLLDLGGASEYPMAEFWYAVMLKLNGKYEEASDALQKFLEIFKPTNEEDKRFLEIAKKEQEGCKLALIELKSPQKDYEFQNLKQPVNTGLSDYSPVIYENDSSIVIGSSRKESKGDDEYGYLGGEFSDNFRFKKGESGWEQMHDQDLFSGLHTEYNESPGSFTADKTKFYFTRCDEMVKVEGVLVHECAIYVSEFREGKWDKPVKLNENINAKGQWNAQPDISPNGDTLFFVSKRPGGYGMHDIYFSISTGKDDWGPAQNLGPVVNTPFIDMSPCYYSKEQTLFFSSNGREGFGGLDIYRANGPGFSNIKNAGLPFNSNRDDFYFVLGENKGFLSSNREGGIGNDDVYWFNIKGKECVIAKVEKDSLGDAKSISIVGTLKVKETGLPAKDLEILLKNKLGEKLKTTRTDDEGLFRLENLTPEDLKVVIEDFDPRLTFEVKYIVDKVEVKKSEQIVSRTLFENIYFDFDKYTLRPEAKKVLDELVAYTKQYPEVQIEMNANTDAFGSDEYNIRLAHNRGKASLDYLISKGVKKSVLVVNAKGETAPIATNNHPAGRQLNRRVEFYIVGGPGYQAKAMAYVIEPKITLYSVAKKFNMTVEELKELNGLTSEKIEAFRPLRVARTNDEDIIAPSTLYFVKNAPKVDFPDKEKKSKKETRLKEREEKENKREFRENTDYITSSDKIENKVERKTTEVRALKADEQYHVVEYGHNLHSISSYYAMTVEELIKLNGLTSTDLYVGQKLIVKNHVSKDPSAYYIVKSGDTLFLIARKFGLNVEELKEMNNLKSDTVYYGMSLRVKK